MWKELLQYVLCCLCCASNANFFNIHASETSLHAFLSLYTGSVRSIKITESQVERCTHVWYKVEHCTCQQSDRECEEFVNHERLQKNKIFYFFILWCSYPVPGLLLLTHIHSIQGVYRILHR